MGATGAAAGVNIALALEMSTEERSTRLAGLRESVHSWNAAAWLTAQLTELGVE